MINFSLEKRSIDMLIKQERRCIFGFLVMLFSLGVISGYFLSKGYYSTIASMTFAFLGMGFGIVRLIDNVNSLKKETKTFR